MIYIILTVQILFVINMWLTNKQLDDLQNQINKLREDQFITNYNNRNDLDKLIKKLENESNN